MVKITCLGATESVTGSNFLVEASDGRRLIVDCGLFQGGAEMERRNWDPWAYDPKQIEALILTHAHIDHSGRIPKLVKDGFEGKIFASPPTVELCEVMLLDSAHVQEMESEWRTRKNRRRAQKSVAPLYTTADSEKSLRFFVPRELDQTFEVQPGITARFRNAGHILGSSIVELWIEDEGKTIKTVFSGDIGRQDALIVESPEEIADADYLFVESTYGNRLHRPFEESKAELLEAIRYAVSHREKVIIPAFAVERTQEVLYILGEFARSWQLPDIPVYLDSPLAIKATEIFRKNKKYYDEDAKSLVGRGFDPFALPNLKLTLTTSESMRINQLQGPAIVISANGMCTAGRIKHHLKHNLWRPGASIVITGFQSQGSTGRQIVEGAESVTIFGEKVAVRAKIFTIGGISAHADQADLLAWIGHFAAKSKPRTFIIHGEPESSQALARAVKDRYGLEVRVPQWREVLQLTSDRVVTEMPPRAVTVDLRQQVLDLATELETEITRLKAHLAAHDAEVSEEDLKKLEKVRQQVQTLM